MLATGAVLCAEGPVCRSLPARDLIRVHVWSWVVGLVEGVCGAAEQWIVGDWSSGETFFNGQFVSLYSCLIHT